ncbi:AccI family restriction endonuclease [Bombella intestini]|uniref:AccI family restriction endonuclease n=1 Tax=Bombella intestini TaxID=1539051 RepID=UPI0009860248|nr:AccI family restriction endonuclease [Bombella intestini]
MKDYFRRLTIAKDKVIDVLNHRGVPTRHLQFGGVGQPLGRIFPPTDVRSEFLANRAMGDWAENLLANTINHTLPGYRVVHYGNSDRISAGEEGFKDFYRATLEDVRIFGKRPDLLIVPNNYNGPSDVSSESTEILRSLVSQALVAIEVRSSKFEALYYAQVRAQERELGRRGGRSCQSFTVKLEDLKVVFRWIENFQKPQIYCQVFFDSMFAINVLDIFEIIGNGSGFNIESPDKSQGKITITIPVTSGQKVATYTSVPNFEVQHHRTRLGRHDGYVRPVGGDVSFDADTFLDVILGRRVTLP